MALGMMLGAGFGTVLGKDNIATSISIGMLLGMVIGMSITKK